MRLFDLLTMFHNWVSDKDFVWWPFSFLRPEKDELITFKLSLLMTACFGGLAFSFFTVFSIMNNVLTASSLVMTFLSCFPGFFIWFNAVTRPLWNRRARQLQEEKRPSMA